MTIRLTAIAVALATLAPLSGTADAQDATAESTHSMSRYRHGNRPIVVNPGYGYYGGYHASTIAEGYFRGIGAMAEGIGSYNYNTSLSAINLEEARRLAMLNYEQSVVTRFAVRETNRQYRMARRNPVDQARADRFNKSRLPNRLAAAQLDPATGEINWPKALSSAEFAQQRERLQELFLARDADNAGPASELCSEVKQLVSSMRQDVNKCVSEMAPSEFIAVRHFLGGLAYEAHFGAEPVEQLASN